MAKRKIIINTVLALVLILIGQNIFRIHRVHAESITNLLNTVGNSSNYDTSKTDPAELAGNIIKIFLSLLGIIFIGLIIYAGYLWMSARGEAEHVKKAQDILRESITGLIIIIGAYVITYFVLASIASKYINQSGF